MTLSKLRRLNLRKYFHFVPNSKKKCSRLRSTFLTDYEKLIDSDFVFENRTKLKIPFEMLPPLTALKIQKKFPVSFSFL